MIADAGLVFGSDVSRRGTSPGGNHAAGRYRSASLSEIPLETLVPVKVTLSRCGSQDHDRWVFRSRGSDTEAYFYKIWNSTYVRRDNLLDAIACGFVDDETAPALDGLIFHRDICRGYIMKACRSERGLLDDRFRELIYGRTRSTEHFLVQLSDHHVMRSGPLRSLIDLEGIYPMDALPHLQAFNCRFEDTAYARMVLDHYRRAYRGADEIDVNLLLPDPAASKRRRARRLLRRVKRTIRNHFPRTALIRTL